MFGVQFHPEVDLTKCGTQMFKNFLFNVSYRRIWEYFFSLISIRTFEVIVTLYWLSNFSYTCLK